MERILPTVELQGTLFEVDVYQDILRQKGNPSNIIPLSKCYYDSDHYYIPYNPITQTLDFNAEMVKIKPLGQIDPENMAAKYGKPLEYIKFMTDYQIVVDDKALELRERGQLPILNIMNYRFYVDLRMGSLRPHDDFSTEGIKLSQAARYSNEDDTLISIPYNPKKHEFEPLDYDTITQIPKIIFPIEFPTPRFLDPVSYVRLLRLPLENHLRFHPLVPIREARVMTWEEFGLPAVIARNRANLKRSQRRFRPDDETGHTHRPPK